MEATKKQAAKEQAFSNISLKSFLTVVLVLVGIIALSAALTYFIPQGNFSRNEEGVILIDTYTEGETSGISLWRVFTAPGRVFASEDGLTIIVISLFLLIMSGIFNLLDKTGGIRIFISQIIRRLKGRKEPVILATVLIFMLFGSFFGMFEELVTLLPIMILFMLSLGLDTMLGLGTCLLAACFGFSAAITNPFSVGLASQYMGISPVDGIWLRLVFFGLIFATLSFFLIGYQRKLMKTPSHSLSYDIDTAKRSSISTEAGELTRQEARSFRIYGGFFTIQICVLLAIASIRAISDLAIPILAGSFLIFGIIAGLLVCRKAGDVFKPILQGATAMLPAVIMIALASSVKLIMVESGILDTVMYFALQLLEGKSKFLVILLIYGLILFLQIFIGSASAKIILVMPIVMPIATALGISPSLVILTYCMADGFSDAIIPTNPVLLIGLSMANVSYGKWVKWTWKLQIFVFLLTVCVLLFGVAIGY